MQVGHEVKTMNKIWMSLALTLASSGALAGWDAVGTGAAYTTYIDRASIRRSGTMTKMWSLLDSKSAQMLNNHGTFKSMKTQDEYDCAEERYRSLYFVFFTDNMGEGSVIATGKGAEIWTPYAPESTSEVLWNVACGKP